MKLKTYAAALWGPWPNTQRRLRELWRELLRNPHRRFRRVRPYREPLYVVDCLAEQHGLRSPEQRLRAVVEQATTALLEAAEAADQDNYRRRRADLDAALDAVHRLRRLRLGPSVLGERVAENDPLRGGPRRPKWWD